MTSAPCRGSCSWGHFCCLRLAASSCTSRFCFKCRGYLAVLNRKNNTICIQLYLHLPAQQQQKRNFVFLRLRTRAVYFTRFNALAVYEPRSMGFAADSSGPTARARNLCLAENRRTCSRARSTPPPPHLTTRRAQAGAAACWMPRCSSFNIWRGIASASWPTGWRQALTSSTHALRRGCQSAQPRAARRCWV